MKYTAKPLPPVNLPELRQVGKPLRRVDALGKCTGSTVYAGDIFLPNMLHGKIFRSSIPHGRIVRMDVSKARALPGVACVITAAELPQSVLVTDMPGQTGQKRRAGSDAHILAADIVRFIGDPIALVAAETQDAAERDLDQLEGTFERVPCFCDPLAATLARAPWWRISASATSTPR